MWQVAGKAPSYSAIIPSKQGVAASGRQDALVVEVSRLRASHTVELDRLPGDGGPS